MIFYILAILLFIYILTAFKFTELLFKADKIKNSPIIHIITFIICFIFCPFILFYICIHKLFKDIDLNEYID